MDGEHWSDGDGDNGSDGDDDDDNDGGAADASIVFTEKIPGKKAIGTTSNFRHPMAAKPGAAILSTTQSGWACAKTILSDATTKLMRVTSGKSQTC